MRVFHEFQLAGGAGREVDQGGVIRAVWVVSRDNMATASASRTGATRRSVADRDAAEIPWDAVEFVDLVGTGDDMAHRSPTDGVSEVLGPQCGGRRRTMRSAARELPIAMGSNQSSAQLNRPPMSGQRKAATAAL
jgi:hypothetical protein